MTRGNKILTIAAFALMTSLCVLAQSRWTQMPASFKHTQKNSLIGAQYLDSALIKAADSTGIRIVLIGDSHVKGKSFPQSLEATLLGTLPRLNMTFYGINGAWVEKFEESALMQKVYDERPDIVIVSFGTNESHGPNYNESTHTREMMSLVTRLESRCPGVKIILTTPPGSYFHKRVGGTRRRPRYSFSRNEVTPRVARNIVKFAADNHIACWDLFSIAGGELYACTNWRDNGYMQSDNTHYTAHGYSLMGKLLGEAIIKTYYERVAH